MKNTAQLADTPLPDNVHGLPKNRPSPLLVKLTVPDGIDCPLLAVSVTVAVQIVAAPGANTLGEQLTLVEVACVLDNGVIAIPEGPGPAATVACASGESTPVTGSTLYWR